MIKPYITGRHPRQQTNTLMDVDLSQVCFFALLFSESDLANLGQLYRDERLKQKAESMRLDNCEKLHRLVVRQRGK